NSVATVKEYLKWTERDIQKAESWVIERSEAEDVVLDKKMAQHLVERVGLDQWLLAQAIDKLSFVDEVDLSVIDDVIEPSAEQNVFQLFELALNGGAREVKQTIDNLQLTQDPYQLFGLISSQALQL